MEQAILYFKEKPYLLLILAALIVLAVWSWMKAGKAAAKRQKENAALLKKMDEDTALMREFLELTAEKAENAEPEKLVKGVALGLCRRIEKAADIQKEFDTFTGAQKQIYALYFVFEDGGKALSAFFKANGQPLTGCAKAAVTAFYPGEGAEVFEKEYLAYDEDDETTSLIPADIAEQDAAFLRFIENNDVWSAPADYIKANLADFLN